MEILISGHLDSIGVCLDLAHAHLTTGIPAASPPLQIVSCNFTRKTTTVCKTSTYGQEMAQSTRRPRPLLSTRLPSHPPSFLNSAPSCPMNPPIYLAAPQGLRVGGLSAGCARVACERCGSQIHSMTRLSNI